MTSEQKQTVGSLWIWSSSALLFLASVALPSFLWNRDEWRTNDEKQKIDVRRAASDIDDDDENDSGAGGDAAAASRRPMDWYAKRRHEDRLSFHEIDYNINSNTGTNIHASHTSSNTSSIPTTLFRTTAASADVSLPQPPMPHPPLPHSSSSFESAPSQHFPATSNNCNWNHFEGYHDTTKNCVDYESLNDDEATNDADRNNVTGSNNTNTNHCSSETTETTNRRRRHHSDGPPTITPTKSQWPPAPPRRGLSHRSVTEGSIPLAQQPLLLSTTTSSVNTNNNNIMSGAGIVSKLWSLRRTNSVPELAAATGGEDAKPNSPPLLQQHVQNRAARSKYNASIMPNRLILIRHGQSLGNIDEKLYATTADNAMPLTQLGWEQAKAAGRQVRSMTQNNNATNDTNNNHTASSSSNNNNNGSVHFVMSPYVRTVETFHGIASAWCDPSEFAHMADREERLQAWYARLHEMGLTWNEDPRIREQDFGNYQEPDKIKQAKRDRYRFGAFYYRFPYGESASDVFDRVSTFLDSLWRSFDTNNARNYVLITHGISIRVILARYFRYTIDQFHLLVNPRNCDIVELRHDGTGRLELGGYYELDHIDQGKDLQPLVVGYKFHKRLRVLPQARVKKVKIRMSFND